MANLSNHYDSLTFCKTSIEALSLSGLTGGVVIQEVPNYKDGTIALPFVSVSPWGRELNPTTGPVSLNEKGYGVLVAIVASPDVNALETRLYWRQRIFNKLIHRVDSGDRNYNMEIEPANAVDVKAFLERGLFVSAMVARAWFQEARIP